MIILDTDRLSVLQFAESQKAQALRTRIDASGDADVATTIITAEAQVRGRLSVRHAAHTPEQIVIAYDASSRLFAFYASWVIVPFDGEAATLYEAFPRPLIRRIGRMDARIAAIAKARRAAFLSRNRRHFEQVPNLDVENWLLD